MDKTTALVFICLLSCCCTALEIGIYGDSKYNVKPGEERNFVCHVDQGLPVILSHTLQWIHESLMDKDNPVQTVLTSQQTLASDAEPDFYGIDVKYDSSTLNNTLTLKNVQPASDGKLICRATPTQGGETVEAEVEIVAVSDVQSISLNFDGEGVVTGEDPTPVEREQGDDFGVTCEASGFNPTASIRIFLGEQELTTGGTDIAPDSAASAAAGARRYIATASATNIKLTASHSGEKLSCQAKADYAEDAATLKASIPLIIISLEPTIKCDKNVSAWMGDKYIKIRCEVHHENVEIVTYSWEIGSTGEIIYPGNVTDDHDEVIVEKINDKLTIVTLDLYEVEDWHFNTAYYLDVHTKSGQKFRETATITKKETTGGAVAVAVAQSAVIFLCFCLSSLFSL